MQEKANGFVVSLGVFVFEMISFSSIGSNQEE